MVKTLPPPFQIVPPFLDVEGLGVLGVVGDDPSGHVELPFRVVHLGLIEPSDQFKLTSLYPIAPVSVHIPIDLVLGRENGVATLWKGSSCPVDKPIELLVIG